MGIVEPTIGADPFAAGSLEEVIGGARVVWFIYKYLYVSFAFFIVYANI